MENIKLNKVPEITLYFWIIKILCTTMGETGADYLIENYFGLLRTTYVMTVVLIFAIFLQFKVRKYVPFIYWLTVVLLSIVGTLITDLLTDNFQVSLITSTVLFSAALIVTFIIWYREENTLSIRSINTGKREAFYWLVILFTFALGTAAGDLCAEKFRLGYLVSTGIFGSLIVCVTAFYYASRKALKNNPAKLDSSNVLSFWLAYILTRPLGASIGDYLSQDTKYGGLGMGPTVTSLLFFATILVLIVYLTISKVDQIKE